jgi:hypothetical protein
LIRRTSRRPWSASSSSRYIPLAQHHTAWIALTNLLLLDPVGGGEHCRQQRQGGTQGP